MIYFGYGGEEFLRLQLGLLFVAGLFAPILVEVWVILPSADALYNATEVMAKHVRPGAKPQREGGCSSVG